MWRYLVLNTLWFLMLFFVQFYGSVRSRRVVFVTVLGAAVFLATRPGIDPLAWLAYAAFSILTFWSASRMRLWLSARSEALDEELEDVTKRLEIRKRLLDAKKGEVGEVERQVAEIVYLCEKIKEMSQTREAFDTFLVLGEALSRDFKFESLKLVFLGENESQEAASVHHFLHSDFREGFERSAFAKDPDRSRGEILPFDRRVIEQLLKSRRPLVYAAGTVSSEDERLKHVQKGLPFIAYPIAVERRIIGVLIAIGMRPSDIPIFSVLAESFVAEVRRVKLYEKVETLALSDGLTGVAARRHLLERLEDEVDRSRRMGLKLSFLMIDVDNFKLFNDVYGHLVGDVVLREVADTIKRNIREVDLVGRYGGEEFGVFLIETDESGAFYVAERIRRAVAERAYRAYNEDLKVTVSVGCATFPGVVESAQQLIDEADAAMYTAKAEGRNRVHLTGLDTRNRPAKLKTTDRHGESE